MVHSLKNTLILMFSIFAMLMSNYVSSAPNMMVNNLLVNSITTAPVIDHQIPSKKVSVSDAAQVHHTGSKCHLADNHSSTAVNIELSPTDASVVNKHCDNGDGNIHICCTSVCSSVSYPIQATHFLSGFASSLALYRPIKIGDKVTRSQSILRPPSA